MRMVTQPHCDSKEWETTQRLIKSRWLECSLRAMVAQWYAGSLSAFPTRLSGSKENAVQASNMVKRFNLMSNSSQFVYVCVCVFVYACACVCACVYALVSAGWRTMCGDSGLSSCVGYEYQTQIIRVLPTEPSCWPMLCFIKRRHPSSETRKYLE